MIVNIDVSGVKSEEVLRHFICAICTDVLENPYRTPCHHVFCFDCISKALIHKKECPLDHEPLSQEQLIQDKVIQRIVGDFPCDCIYRDEGCNWKGSVSERHHHLTSCLHEKVNCVFVNCKEKVKRIHLENHISSCQHRYGEKIAEKERKSEMKKENVERSDYTNRVDALVEPGRSNRIHENRTNGHGNNRQFSLDIFSIWSYIRIFKMVLNGDRDLYNFKISDITNMCLIFSSATTLLPFFILLSICGFNILSLENIGMSKTSCLVLSILVDFLWIVKLISVKMPFIYGVTIVDEVPVKFILAILIGVIMVLATTRQFSPVEVGIVAASTVGIFVIYYIRNVTAKRTNSPVKRSALDLISLTSTVLVVGIRSTFASYEMDNWCLLFCIFLSFSLGVLIGLLRSIRNRHPSSVIEHTLEYIQFMYREWMLSVVSALYVLEGNGVNGVKAIYVLAAANHWKLMFYFCSPSKSLMDLQNHLLVGLTFLLWSMISIFAFDLFDAKVYYWNDSTLFPLSTWITSATVLSLNHYSMAIGRILSETQLA